MSAYFGDLLSGVSSLWNQAISAPACELIIENQTAVELSLPVGRDFKLTRQGEIGMHPELFFTLRSIKPGDRGIIKFLPTSKILPIFHGAVEIEAPNEGYPSDKLFVGSSSQGPGIVADWNFPGGLRGFVDSMPTTEPVPKLVVAGSYFSELFYDEKVSSYKLVVRSRQPGTFGLNSRLQSQSQNNESLVDGDFRLVLDFVNYTEAGLSLPPNYAHMVYGCVEKEFAYIQKGGDQKGRVEFGGSPEFSGNMFLQVGPEEILVIACKGLKGDVKLNVFFHDVNPQVGSLVLPDHIPSPERFCGEDQDETVLGRHCEALITNVKQGDNAHATIAIYSRESSEQL